MISNDGVSGSGFASAKGQEAYRAIQHGIQHGRYGPGSRLKEVELASEFGMSRTPIREAIRQLERDGVLTILPNRGAVVRRLTAEEVEDTYALRAVLEGFCASRAATRMDPMAIDHLAEINEEMERIARGPDAASERSVESLIRLNSLFHLELVKGSRNTRVAEVLEKATEVPRALKHAFWASPRARESADVYHREIVRAVRSRDPIRAEAVMRSHIYAIKDHYTQERMSAGIHRLIDDSSEPSDLPDLGHDSDGQADASS